MEELVKFTLSYSGEESDDHQIDLYDVSQALIGFQRSIALTTHLIINGEIITQAPSLKGARIYASPAQEGSWKMTATVLAGIYAIGTAPKDTPLGHIIFSAYDYVISESLGVHVDYDETIGQLVEKARKKNESLNLEQHKLDSLVEKCSTAITEIHRPIYKTETASEAVITSSLCSKEILVGRPFSYSTYEYIHEEYEEEEPNKIKGRISSYNSNTFKGRIYVAKEGRPVSFELSENCRSFHVLEIITGSLTANALKNYSSNTSEISCLVLKITTRNGHLKSYKILEVDEVDSEI